MNQTKIKKTVAVIVAVLVGLLVVSLLITRLFVSLAYGGEDHFGREYTTAVSWSADADHLAGVRLTQVREHMPGVWIEGLFSGSDQAAQAGLTQRLTSKIYLVAGGGYQFDAGRWTAHLGAGASLGWLALHTGYNTASSAVTFGAGWTFDM